MVRDYQEALTSSLEQRLDTEQLPQEFQLELIGTGSEGRLDTRICPWDAIKVYEFDAGVEWSKFFYEPKALDPVKSVYTTNTVEKQRVEETQLELYETGE